LNASSFVEAPKQIPFTFYQLFVVMSAKQRDGETASTDVLTLSRQRRDNFLVQGRVTKDHPFLHGVCVVLGDDTLLQQQNNNHKSRGPRLLKMVAGYYPKHQTSDILRNNQKAEQHSI